MIGIGVIGTGGIADACHGPAIAASKRSEITAVLSRKLEAAQAFASRHGVKSTSSYSDFDNFLSDPNIELVVVASPDRLHFQHALASISAGKHVLLEKPMAVSVEEAEELQRKAEERKVSLGVGFHLRHHRGHRELHNRLVNQRELGEIRHIRAIWAFPQQDNSNWRASSELGKWWSLAAVGAHCFDSVRWFAGDFTEWESFHSVISHSKWGSFHDESAVIAAKFQSGPTTEVASSVQFGPYTRIEIFCDGGIALCDQTMGREGGGRIDVNSVPLKFEKESPFVGQLNEMENAIIERRQPCASGIAGVRNVRDLLASADL